MSSGTGESRHCTGPAAERDAQIMTMTAPATPSNGDVNGLEKVWFALPLTANHSLSQASRARRQGRDDAP